MKMFKDKILKVSVILFLVMLLSMTCYLPKTFDETVCSSQCIVYAADEAEIPTIGASESTDGDNASDDGNTQKDADAAAQAKSSSTFFKWAIPITCVLSLILAVILAVRGANKRYGKEW